MKIQKIISAILIGLGCSGLFLACGNDAEPTPTPLPPDGGQGGEMIEDSSSSSSSSSGSTAACLQGQTENCPSHCIVQDCQRCQGFGCDSTFQLCDVAVKLYFNQIECLQDSQIQENCSACQGLSTGDPISYECVNCAANIKDCNLDCSK